MNKRTLILLSALLLVGMTPVAFGANKADNAEKADKGGLDTTTVYYPNATMKSIVSKYQSNNITGCLQETFSYVKIHPNDSAGYYYMALAYTRIGKTDKAQEAYEKAIELNSSQTIVEYSNRGKACLSGDKEKCNPEAAVSSDDEELTDLDKFIRAPYGNGLSPEINKEIQEKELKRLQQEINNGNPDVQNDTRQFNKRGSIKFFGEKLASADLSNTPSNKEVLDAIDTLKRAGLQLNVETPNENDVQKVMSDPEVMSKNAEYAQLNMLLGNNNNNNNSMMNVIPYLFSQDGTVNKDINPRVIETMMTSSMLDAYNGYNNNNSNY